MSEMIMCHIVCDGDSCGRVFGNEPTMLKVRERAEKLGWIHLPKKEHLNMEEKDYCPLCKKKLLLKEG